MEYNDTLEFGSTLADDYEIIKVLGTGGFGNTYHALDRNLNREVAIKEFFPRGVAVRENRTLVHASSPRFESSFKWGLERFVQEARLLARFRHPNIVRVFRTFEANNTSYIVLDYVRGHNLELWLTSLGRLPTQRELDELFAPVVDALALVHAAGVLHRDIKPENICVREETGDPVLLDFGASKFSMSEMTGTTAAIVSRGYSPYEAYAAESKSQGAWTDIYGLGATIYRAVTGAPPPEATERVLGDTCVPLASQALPDLRAEFLAAVDWSLSVQPGSRPQNVADWRKRLFAADVSTARGWQGSTLLLRTEAADTAPTRRRDDRAPAAPEAPPRKRSSALTIGLSAAGVLGLGAGGLFSANHLGLIEMERMLGIVSGQKVAVAPTSPTAPQPGPPAAATKAPASPSVSAEPPSAAAAAPVADPEGARLASRPSEPAPASEPSGMSTPSANVAKPQELAALAPLPAAPAAPRGPEYRDRVLGTIGGSPVLTTAAVSPDGRQIVAGALDGSVRSWNVESGEEHELAPAGGSPVLAIEFSPSKSVSLLAAKGDGVLAAWAGGEREPRLVKAGILPGGFVKALGFSTVAEGFVAVATGPTRTRVLRWNGSSEQEPTVIDVAGSLARAAAIARNEDLVVTVGAGDVLEAFRYSDGRRSDHVAWISPLQEWTTTLAITDDGRLLARAGQYPFVYLYDLSARTLRLQVQLGEQAHVRRVTFSADRQRLAIDFQFVEGRVVRNRIRIIAVEDGARIAELDSVAGPLRWLSFMPGGGSSSYWLASTQDSAVRLCNTSTRCDRAE